jgi:hypothetical protein
MVLRSAVRSAPVASAMQPTAEAPAEQQAPEPANRLKTGQLLNNRYAIVKSIGSGGMGAVYLAEDVVLKRQVVIKALLSEGNKELVAQSIKEREFLATIKHANIVSIYDFLTIGTQGFIVMEHVNGKTLEQIMEEQGHPFEVAEAIRYLLGILPAFTYPGLSALTLCHVPIVGFFNAHNTVWLAGSDSHTTPSAETRRRTTAMLPANGPQAGSDTSTSGVDHTSALPIMLSGRVGQARVALARMNRALLMRLRLLVPPLAQETVRGEGLEPSCRMASRPQRGAATSY